MKRIITSLAALALASSALAAEPTPSHAATMRRAAQGHTQDRTQTKTEGETAAPAPEKSEAKKTPARHARKHKAKHATRTKAKDDKAPEQPKQ